MVKENISWSDGRPEIRQDEGEKSQVLAPELALSGYSARDLFFTGPEEIRIL
jgi:hypothetical protein